jgi:Cof subfamily protein (haloacid dehalogenase superfamily)
MTQLIENKPPRCALIATLSHFCPSRRFVGRSFSSDITDIARSAVLTTSRNNARARSNREKTQLFTNGFCSSAIASPARYNVRVPIKLIAMDIDGTLLDSNHQLPAENARAIAAAAARGIDIMLVTGRRFDSARNVAAELDCDVHLIVSNGALIKSVAGGTEQRSLLPAATARRVLDATTEFRACSGVIFDRPSEAQVVFEKIDWNGPFIGDYLRKHKKHVAEIDPLTDCLNGEDPVEILFIAECGKVRRVMGMLEVLPEALEYTLALTEYERRDLSMLDVLRRGVTKGAALIEWARARGIARDEIMAVGDNWNDREMLAFAGLPVVMGNSIAELKSLGYAVTSTNDEAGLAAAIHKYAMAEKG